MDAKTIAQERSRLGWSQGELAQRMDTTVRTVSRWETGAVTVPEETARRLVDLFASAQAPISDSERLARLEAKLDALATRVEALLTRG